MKVVKGALKRRLEESLQTRVSRFLFAYRNAPQSTTGRAPAELIFGRALRSPLERLRSSLRAAVGAQAASKAQHDRRAQVRTFSAGDCSGQGSPGILQPLHSAVVVSTSGQSSEMRLGDGHLFTRQHDHLGHYRE